MKSRINRGGERAVCETVREKPPQSASAPLVDAPFDESMTSGPRNGPDSLVNEAYVGCARCGADVHSESGRCSRCGSFLAGPGNNFAVRHGGRSRHAVENDTALALQAEKRTQIRRHLGDVSVVQDDLLGDYVRLDMLIETVSANIGRVGILTSKGRSRAAVSLLLQLLDRRLRYAERLGIEPRARAMNIAETMARFHEEREP